jgi:hypothetical protein
MEKKLRSILRSQNLFSVEVTRLDRCYVTDYTQVTVQGPTGVIGQQETRAEDEGWWNDYFDCGQ